MYSDKNIYWIDNAKAIGIILVVIGHTHSLKNFQNNFVYSFHMPLFFFIAGFLLKDKYLKMKFRLYAKKYFRKIVVPYIIFGLASYLLWLPTNSMRNRAEEYSMTPFYDPLLGLLYGAHNKLYINETLWFFTCLFSTLIFAYFLTKMKNTKNEAYVLILLSTMGLIIEKIFKSRLPWNIELSMIAVSFFWTGYTTSKIRPAKIFDNKIFLLAALLTLSTILAFIVRYNGFVSMNKMIFNNVFLYFAGAFSGIGMILAASKIIPPNGLAYWLSLNTIIIFPLHKIIFNIFEGIGVVFFKLELGFKSNMLFAFFFTIGAIIVCIPASLIIHKYFSWIIGKTPVVLSNRIEKVKIR